ncbi:MAG: hypothetical protein ACJAS1_007447 [Oleiphilaceae bacterium]|jgi:hypothetical protein
MNQSERQTGMGLWTDSREMLEAANVLMPKGISLMRPIYYLLGHSLEVGVKGFLLSHGATQKDIRGIGHDLTLAIEEANLLGLEPYFQFTMEQIKSVKLLNSYYKAKELEYRVTGYKSFPDATTFAEMIHDLLVAIKPVCRVSVEGHA